ncbi:hypothetical protein KPH14_001513 [Odynerus spinipes]|uniref:Uncharacterized protein n=1 Tax=Odynerus spinipes TaxID=1348599 RepID=A0AAD9RUL8_9HYME|nr:hypothetical protein KPH14_001513 [Odynerus spinipes]
MEEGTTRGARVEGLVRWDEMGKALTLLACLVPLQGMVDTQGAHASVYPGNCKSYVDPLTVIKNRPAEHIPRTTHQKLLDSYVSGCNGPGNACVFPLAFFSGVVGVPGERSCQLNISQMYSNDVWTIPTSRSIKSPFYVSILRSRLAKTIDFEFGLYHRDI